MKIRIIIIGCVTVLFLFLGFIISSSFENIYFYKDKNIILNSSGESTKYTFIDNAKKYEGVLELKNGVITFTYKNKEVATAVYDNNTKILEVTGKFGDKEYKKLKFRQVTNFHEYFKTVF